MKKNREQKKKKLRSLLKALVPDALAERFRELRDQFELAGNHFQLQRNLQDRRSWQAALLACSVLFRRGKTILFFPERPPYRFAAYESCTFLGYKIVKQPHRRFDVAFKRSNATFSDKIRLGEVTLPRSEIINSGSSDISKQTVGKVFARVFGYELGVDPESYVGSMIEKSDANGTHDGRIVDGPLAPELIRPGRVYQKLINNLSFREGYFLDYRVPIHGGRIPLVYRKHRPVGARFSVYEHADFKDPEDIFSGEELEKILRMARKMKLDYGEMDVLRDQDGRIYVIDVNNTPRSHTHALPVGDKRASLERMAATFKSLVEQYG